MINKKKWKYLSLDAGLQVALRLNIINTVNSM